MKSRRLLKLVLFSGIISLSGCSSVMSHTGGKEGTYPGTRSSAQTLGDSDTNWGVKSLVALDMPFTAVMDTLLLPCRYGRYHLFNRYACACALGGRDRLFARR